MVGGGQSESVSQLSQNYAKSMGLMPQLPDWMFNGAIVGVQGGTDRVSMFLPFYSTKSYTYCLANRLVILS